jgi:hypothetical protein
MAINILEFSWKINHLRVNTSRIDKLIFLAKSEFNEPAQEYSDQLQNGKCNPTLLFNANKAADVLFSVYALGIIHCYSILENNRVEIMKRIPGLSEAQIKDLYKIDTVRKTLTSKLQIEHGSLSNAVTAQEFLDVNNKLKHCRFAFSNSVMLNDGTKYGVDKLGELYEKRTLLNEYLVDLDSRISAAVSPNK